MTNESTQLDDLRAVLRMLEFARLKIETMDTKISSAELDPVIQSICAELGIECADDAINTEDLAAETMWTPIGTA